MESFSPAFIKTMSLVIGLLYLGILLSLIHLIFKTNYTLKTRLIWMLVLWMLPGLGLLVYWIYWYRRNRETEQEYKGH